ncbi:PTS sugar transporter subunit IIA [Bombilactobacillus bombi]|uniref:PTS sugar transporter subunit IIA n=1 Tax=Bombilactobacillus bombi TaxID=1303590 RepID=UPI0015E5D1AB|nr:PTS mannose transporter subunit IIA [Bombilactobacillus bombi]MBA1433856.1 PTS mannose transporter subunit IIA [Bombilactobacillus bombi]
MIKYILVSHGKLASGMKSMLEVILGKRDDIVAIDAYIDDFDFEKSIQNIINHSDLNKDKLIFVSDLLGGSVNNYLLNYLSTKNIYIITGMNSSLLLTLLTSSKDKNIKQIISQSINASKDSIMDCSDLDLNQAKDDIF